MPKHVFILTSNAIRSSDIVQKLTSGAYVDFDWINDTKVGVFSQSQLDYFIEEEERHDKKVLTVNTTQPLKTMSSGERKKALLGYLLNQEVVVLILVNPFDNLDMPSQKALEESLLQLAAKVSLIQISNRTRNMLHITNEFYEVHHDLTFSRIKKSDLVEKNGETTKQFQVYIPPPLKKPSETSEILVEFNKVSVAFSGKPVLKDIDWTIRSNEFWQLLGPNGSGKSTLLQMITGDSHKGYGQDLTLFGQKKGSGESVWDIKSFIGYFSPAMVDRFRGYHTLENMIISGLHDSVGLYYTPSDVERNLALQWLESIGLLYKKNDYFNTLSLGEKRLLLTARAMIKHPPLLILDEPTVGLDDTASLLFVGLVNHYAKNSNSAIVYVSHQDEPQLKPEKVFELQLTAKGSIGA